MNNTATSGAAPAAALYARFGTYAKTGLEVSRAGRYVRLSRKDGDKEESDSIANQKELIRAFAQDKPDIEIKETYEDDDYSGVNFDRPGFQRMMEDIRSGKIDCVIVKDLSRLGRNYIETGKLLERFFPFMNVRFIAINDAYDSKHHNAQTDSLIIPFKNLINDTYCADISKKIRSQFEVRRQNGEYIGSFAAFGYLKAKDETGRNQLVIDENAAPIIRDIFQWKIEGQSAQGIADKLNTLGVPSPLEYKRQCGSNYTTVFGKAARSKWTAVAVGRILRNDLYVGVLTQGISTTANYKIKQRIQREASEWARVEGTHEAIISAEDFSLVAGLLKSDTRSAPGSHSLYLFSGLLYCGDCGRSLVRKPAAKGKYASFVCSTYKHDKKMCQSHSISERIVSEAVFETLTLHIRECVELERMLDFIGDMPLHRHNAQKLQKQIADKQAEIECISARRVKLYENFADGIMSRAEYERICAAFERQANEADAALLALESELDRCSGNNGQKNRWIEHYKKYHNLQSLTRNAVVELIERITVYQDRRLEIKLRYQSDMENAIAWLSAASAQSDMEKAVI